MPPLSVRVALQRAPAAPSSVLTSAFGLTPIPIRASAYSGCPHTAKRRCRQPACRN